MALSALHLEHGEELLKEGTAALWLGLGSSGVTMSLTNRRLLLRPKPWSFPLKAGLDQVSLSDIESVSLDSRWGMASIRLQVRQESSRAKTVTLQAFRGTSFPFLLNWRGLNQTGFRPSGLPLPGIGPAQGSLPGLATSSRPPSNLLKPSV